MKIKEYSTEIFIVLGFIAFIIIFNFLSIQQNNRFDEFYNSNLIGRIEYIEAGNKLMTDFKLRLQSKEFHLFLNDYQNNIEGKGFYDIAQVGDSLYKPAYSDTIYLYRKDSLIKVSFNKKK